MAGILSVALGVFFILGLLYYIFRPFLLVRQGECVVIEYMGTYKRKLDPGLHFIRVPLEAPRKVRWSYTVEAKTSTGLTVQKSEVFEGYRIRTSESMYDMLPVVCNTEDNVRATVNLTVSYIITDVEKAVYSINDLYLAIECDLETALVGVVRTLSCTNLKSMEIEKRMRSAIGELRWPQEYGITLRKCQLQNITIPEKVQEVTLKYIAQDVETRAEMKNIEAQHEKEMAKLDYEEKLRIRSRQIALVSLEHELKQKEKECQAECVRREHLHKQKMEADEQELALVEKSSLGKDFHIAFLQGKNWAKLMSNGNLQKMIVPAHFTSFLGGQDLLPMGK